ncbi:60S ribosomal subunit assembly/export protein [Pseudocyphellaria aurata]|nr:60S ribosomal subunit assembly/export protein [Pseudocyphellaria aurata]
MAPTKTIRNKLSLNKSSKGGKGSKTSASLGANTSRSRVSKIKAPPPRQQKTRSAPAPVKKKKRVYTDKELGLPQLNMITPVGVELPKGKKKGKVFVDDQESMMTILAIVNASKEGQIESKIMKSRQMEEIREARRKEAEAKQEQRRSKLEETKDSLRRKRKKKSAAPANREASPSSNEIALKESKAKRKRVSFA